MTTPDLALLDTLLSKAKASGATAADVVLSRSTSLSVAVREGKVETIERSESADVGLRVIVGQKQAVIATSSFAPDKLDEMVGRVVDMAKATPDDPYVGLADPAQLCTNPVDLDLAEAHEPDPQLLIKAAGEAEQAARAVSGVTNSDGGDAGWGRSDVLIAASNGFSGSYARSSCSLSANALAGTGTAMERDHDYDSAIYWGDLRDPLAIGRKAGERAVGMLGSRRVTSQQVPVIYEQREARDIVSHFLAAINGGAVARGASFLKDKLGQAVMASHIVIHDDPFIQRAPRSRPFDGEGLPVQQRKLVDNGILTTWLLNLWSARKLGLQPSGHASRNIGSAPGQSASNVWLAPGTASVDELIADIKQGLFLTDTLGHGTNMVTGDYSRGARGFWIENGKLTYPVSELTVAGNLADMFKAITPASDLDRRFGIDSPSLRIDGLTIAGQ